MIKTHDLIIFCDNADHPLPSWQWRQWLVSGIPADDQTSQALIMIGPSYLDSPPHIHMDTIPLVSSLYGPNRHNPTSWTCFLWKHIVTIIINIRNMAPNDEVLPHSDVQMYIWAKICWLSRTNPTFCRWVLTSFFGHSLLCIVSIIQNVALVLDNLQIFAHFSDWSLSGDPQFIGNVHLFPGRRFERHHLNLEFSDRIGSRVSGKFDAAFSNETVDANWSVKRGGNLLRINSRPSRHDPLPFLQNLKRRKRDRECNLIAVIKINSKPTSNAADLERLLTNLGRKCANFESFLVKCGGFLV